MPIEKFKKEILSEKEKEDIKEKNLKKEQVKNVPHQKTTEGPSKIEQSAPAAIVKLPPTDEETVIIKSILSEDVAELYSQLSNLKKRAFRKKGEEVALKIKKILEGSRVRVHEIFELIKNWLKMLPKISIHFLEQEAKIKTDKLLDLKREGQIIEK